MEIMEFEKLQQIIAEVLNIDPEDIKMNTTFVDDLGADSLDIFQIIMGIEETFDIEIDNNDAEIIIGQYGLSVEKVKPYLFPLSSMTEEQKKELQSLIIQDAFGTSDNIFTTQDFYCKYHLDYRGLNKRNLANNATNKNIY